MYFKMAKLETVKNRERNEREGWRRGEGRGGEEEEPGRAASAGVAAQCDDCGGGGGGDGGAGAIPVLSGAFGWATRRQSEWSDRQNAGPDGIANVSICAANGWVARLIDAIDAGISRPMTTARRRRKCRRCCQ